MQEECIVCKAPLIYLKQDEWMECELCHKKELSKTRCQNGHYVCNDCHTKGLDTILSLCIDETSRNPIEIVRKMMDAPFCHMHGPEHHVMVGAALLTAYKNAGGAINLRESVMEMLNRGKAVPGGTCGFWGCLRSGNQRRYVCIYLVWGDATDGGILGTFESDDIKSTGSDFAHRRSEVL